MMENPTGQDCMVSHTSQGNRSRWSGSRASESRWSLALLIGLVIVITVGCGSSGSAKHATSTTVGKTTTTTRARSSSTTTAAPVAAVLAPPLLPLFPFQTMEEVQTWEQHYRSGGQPPQYLDPSATALAFAQFLGYTEIDKVVGTRSDATGAHVSVGSLVPDTHLLTTAAIVHLVRYGTDRDAPWEVVGTDDTTFTITAPAYGASIISPLHVVGRITGVDESIKIHVQQLHANGYLGEYCCVPAGGTNSPWSATTTFSAPTDPVLILSASTGGHTRRVERFTVNGAKS
jgi:hypothetical protein